MAQYFGAKTIAKKRYPIINQICDKTERKTVDLKIEYLVDQKHFVPELSQLLYQQFGSLAPHRTQKDFENCMLNHCNKDCLPMAFVAIEADKLVGTFSFRQHDMETHKHFSPWIGSVFVHPSRRKEGIGTKLMRQAEVLCKQHDIKTLYLFTPDKQAWYLKLRWERIEEATFNSHFVSIKKKNVSMHFIRITYLPRKQPMKNGAEHLITSP